MNLLKKIGLNGPTVATLNPPPSTIDLLLQLGKNDPSLSITILNSSEVGLTTEEASLRIKEYGENRVAHTKPPRWWVQLVKAFFTPFTIILIAIGATSFATDVI